LLFVKTGLTIVHEVKQARDLVGI